MAQYYPLMDHNQNAVVLLPPSKHAWEYHDLSFCKPWCEWLNDPARLGLYTYNLTKASVDKIIVPSNGNVARGVSVHAQIICMVTFGFIEPNTAFEFKMRWA